MEAEIVKQTDDLIIIEWSKENVGFGQLIFRHKEGCEIEVDAECMSINHIVEVFKSLNNIKDES